MAGSMMRFGALDALRGVAALAILVFHLHAFDLGPGLAPHAYLAVDFFFALSGFVVAHAYGEALRGRMSWRGFVARRAVRLLPLAVLGAVVGLAVLILKWRLYPGREEPLANILISGALNLVMLPSFFSGSIYQHAMFPGDGPLWSLFFELVVNIIWAWIGVRLSVRQLGAVVVVAGCWLATVAALHGSTRMGVEHQTFWGGLARASFGFSIGVLIYRLGPRVASPGATWAAPASFVALAVAYCAPLLIHGRAAALAWDMIWIFVGLPLVVLIGARDTGEGPAARLLGELSYPVYVLHWPCLAVLSGVRQKLSSHMEAPLFYLLALGGVVMISWCVLKCYDEPARAALSRLWWPGREGGAPAPTANGAVGKERGRS